MEFAARLLLVFVTLLCFWSGVGCIVTAFRMRYKSLVWLSLFFALIGWMIGSLVGLPDIPKWSSASAGLALGLYRWCERGQAAGAPLSISRILLWWTRTNYTSRG